MQTANDRMQLLRQKRVIKCYSHLSLETVRFMMSKLMQLGFRKTRASLC